MTSTIDTKVLSMWLFSEKWWYIQLRWKIFNWVSFSMTSNFLISSATRNIPLLAVESAFWLCSILKDGIFTWFFGWLLIPFSESRIGGFGLWNGMGLGWCSALIFVSQNFFAGLSWMEPRSCLCLLFGRGTEVGTLAAPFLSSRLSGIYDRF